MNDCFASITGLKSWSREVKIRDNYTCVRCGLNREDGVRIQAHHIKSKDQFPELRLVLSNGESLCEDCHKSKHGTKRKGGKHHFSKKESAVKFDAKLRKYIIGVVLEVLKSKGGLRAIGG